MSRHISTNRYVRMPIRELVYVECIALLQNCIRCPPGQSSEKGARFNKSAIHVVKSKVGTFHHGQILLLSESGIRGVG